MALIQTTKSNNTGTGSLALSQSSNTTTGNMIIVAINIDKTSDLISSVTDSQGNTYTKITGASGLIGGGAASYLTVFYAYNIKGGTTPTITIAKSATCGIEAIAREYSGLTTTDPLDKTSRATGTATPVASGSTAALTQVDELVIGMGGDDWGTGITYTVGAGYGNLTQQTAAAGTIAMQDKIVSSATAVSSSMAIDQTTDQAGMVATFRILSGPVAYWKLDETSGDRADSVGSSTLTDNNSVTSNPATGNFTTAAQFTAANTEYLSITDNAAISVGGTDFSICIWYRPDTIGNHRILMKAASDANRDYHFFVSTAGFYFGIGNNAGTTPNVGPYGTPQTNNWYFLVGVYDNTAKSISLSVNNSDFITAYNTTTPVDSTGALNIGRNVAGSEYADGRMFGLGIWKRKLTQVEIGQLYWGGRGLVYPFDVSQSAGWLKG